MIQLQREIPSDFNVESKKTSLDSKMKIIGLILALIEGNSSKPSDRKRELQYDFDDLVSISCIASGFKVSFIEFTKFKCLY